MYHKIIQFLCLFVLALFLGTTFGVAAEPSTESVVKFRTEDGMDIYGTLHLPRNATGPIPGVILFAEPGWIVRTTLEQHARGLAQNFGFAALTVDFRGNAKSVNHDRLFETFSQDEVDKLQLDVRGAIGFLSAQKAVDPKRIGIIAVGIGANYSLLEAAKNPSVQALVLVSGTLTDEARNYIRKREDIPVLCIAGGDDKDGFVEMAKAFTLSGNKSSRFVQGMSGHGTGMFTRTKGLSEQMQKWLSDNLKALGAESKITFKTEDGWNLHGVMRIPENAGPKIPGIVLVHGANHDQDTYYALTKELARIGIATLAYDWRGRNMDLDEARPAGAKGEEDRYLDTKAAINFLASQKQVDPNNIGLVGATAGNLPTFLAATGDPRIKTIVSLTIEDFTDPVKKYLAATDIPIFFISSTEDINTSRGYLSDYARQAHAMSKNKGTEFLLYDDAGRGSEMFKTKPELTGMILRWFTEKLLNKPATGPTGPAYLQSFSK